MSFYTTLPSSSCIDIYKNNTVSNFKVNLNPELDFSDAQWHVGLAEFHIRGSIMNVNEKTLIFTFNRQIELPSSKTVHYDITLTPVYENDSTTNISKESFYLMVNKTKAMFKINCDNLNILSLGSSYLYCIVKCTNGRYDLMIDAYLKEGSYNSIEKIIATINDELFSSYGLYLKYNRLNTTIEIDQDIWSTIPFLIRFSTYFNDIVKEPFVEFSSINKKRFKKTLKKYRIEIPKNQPSELLIYCDIVQHSRVGNNYSQILRIVNTHVSDLQINKSIVFDVPHYTPVSCSKTNIVHVQLRDIRGNYFPIDYGHSIVKLHFKREAI